MARLVVWRGPSPEMILMDVADVPEYAVDVASIPTDTQVITSGFGWYTGIRVAVLARAAAAARREGQPRCPGLSMTGDAARKQPSVPRRFTGHAPMATGAAAETSHGSQLDIGMMVWPWPLTGWKSANGSQANGG